MPSVVCIANMFFSPTACLQAHIPVCDTSLADICIHCLLMPFISFLWMNYGEVLLDNHGTL